MTQPDVDRLNALCRKTAPQIQFETHQGLTSGVVETQASRARFYLHGAHVTHFRPAGQQEMLFTSEDAIYDDEKAIRGGVPICFPWFGSHRTDNQAPAHGKARTQAWDFHSAKSDENGAVVVLRSEIPPFQVAYEMEFHHQLRLTLRVTNFSQRTERFEAALHTYFAVRDIHHISIEGLESVPFLNQLENKTVAASQKAIMFTEEIDRIYHAGDGQIVIDDKTSKRRLIVDRVGSASVVVWNPWIEKSARMADFGNDEWQRMCCVETANIEPNAVELASGETHSMTAIHRVEC